MFDGAVGRLVGRPVAFHGKAITSKEKNITMEVKDQFRNDSGGVAGATIIDGSGPKSVPVLPGDTIWLSEDEQALTANAPKREEDNPFVSGTFTLVAEGQNIRHARPLRPVTIEEPIQLGQEVGAAPVASGAAPEGSRPATEEVATPEAVPADPETEVAADGRTVVKKDAPRRKAPTAS